MRSPAAWVGAVVVAGGLALAACGGGGAPTAGTTTTTSSTAATTPSSAGGAVLGTAPAGVAMTTAQLPVVACATTYGVTPSPTTTSLPSTAAVGVPIAIASDVALYSEPEGTMTLVGPKGWTCRGTVGADGSGGLVLTPPGQSVPPGVDPGVAWHVAASSPAAAIVGYESGGSPVQAAAAACALLPAAAAVVKTALGRCPVVAPKRETVTVADGAEAGFADPPGVAGDGAPSGGHNPASGVVLYSKAPGTVGAYALTCTLPAAQRSVCLAAGDNFVRRYGHQAFHH